VFADGVITVAVTPVSGSMSSAKAFSPGWHRTT
jgi:hypothetical protein